MPGFTTHYLFGQQAYQKISSSVLKQAIQKQHTVYCLGLQGPDIFFYDVWALISSRKNPGSVAHTADTGRFLRLLFEGIRIFPTENERQTAQIYILGFLGHYLLDTACHPYVYAMTHYNRHPKGYIGQHLRLETDIDTSLLWHYEHRRPSEFHQNECIALSGEEKATIASLLYFTFSRTYPDLGITRHGIRHAIYAMQAGTKLLYDASGRKKTFLRQVESVIPGYPVVSSLIPADTLIFYRDPCNLKHRLWVNPWDCSKKSQESFYDLFEKSGAQYVLALEQANELFFEKHTTKEFEKRLHLLLSFLGNRCYHSGLNAACYLS